MRILVIGCAVLTLGVIGYSVWVNRTQADAAFSPVVDRLVGKSGELIGAIKEIRENELQRQGKVDAGEGINTPTVDLQAVEAINWPIELLSAKEMANSSFAPFVFEQFVYTQHVGESSVFLVLKTNSKVADSSVDLEAASKVARNWFCERINSSGVVTSPVISVLMELQSSFGEVIGKREFTVSSC